jgi:hypothetical protein
MNLAAFIHLMRAERRAAPKRARIPSGDRPACSADEGLS